MKIETKQFRQMEVGESDTEKRTIEFSVSSEFPVVRYSGNDEFYEEILSHNAEDVNLSRIIGAPLLLQHEMEDVIGVIEGAKIENQRLLVKARFSKNKKAQEVFEDVTDGIRRNVSIGYFLRGCVKKERLNDGQRFYFSWEPYECSIVSVPADPTVGIGRQLEIGDEQKIETEKNIKEKIIIVL